MINEYWTPQSNHRDNFLSIYIVSCLICSHTQSEMATLAQEMNGGTNGGNEIGRKLSVTTPGSSLSLSKFCITRQCTCT